MPNTYQDYALRNDLTMNPFERLMSRLKSRDRRNAHILGILQLDWPASEGIIERLSCLLGDAIQANREPVILMVVEKALHHYSRLVFHENRTKHDDPVRLGGFLNALITETCNALELRITTESGESWTIASGEPFAAWMSRHPGPLTIDPHPHRNEAALRALLYELITTESVKTVLRRAHLEITVDSDRLAAGY